VAGMNIIGRIRGMAKGRADVLSSVWNHPLNRGSKIRAIGDYALWNAVKYTMQARHVVQLTENLDIILGRRENYASVVYAHVLADYQEMMFLAHLLRPDDLFIDVGANVGLYSVWVAGVTGARAIAFEPVPATHAALVQNIRLNALDGRITVHRMAAGETAGAVAMTVGLGGRDHVLTGRRETGETSQVAVDRIDRICEGCRPTAMKVDVEGFEMHALRGTAGILDDDSLKAIVIEMQDWTLNKFGASEEEVGGFLTSFGFAPYRYDPETRDLVPSTGTSAINEIFVRAPDQVTALLRSGPPVRFAGRPGGV
jgi:FkbM family methyltransferase